MSDNLLHDTTGGIFAVKTIGFTGLAGIAAGAVAMALTMPKSTTEFFRRLIVTVLTSVLVGPIFIEMYGFSHYTLRSQVGICFLVGIPSWLIMSYIVHWLEKSENKTPYQIAQELRRIRGNK